MAEVTLAQVDTRFGAVAALRDVSLRIDPGELMVLVGPSGAGKTTLLRVVAGLEAIDHGTLTIDGVVANHLAPARRGVAMVFQNHGLYPHMTARENMAFGLRLAGRSKAEAAAAIEATARLLRITPLLERLPKALSGGERQRVAIGRAIVRRPRIFLFDEPLGGLDPGLRLETRIEIAQLKDRLPDTTMVYVTHDQGEAATLATRIAVMNAGRVEQVGPPDAIRARPANAFVARFLGTPPMNILPARIVETGPDTVVRLDRGGVSLVRVPSEPDDRGAAVLVGIRPEDLALTGDEGWLFEGAVSLVEAGPEATLVYFQARQRPQPVIARLPAGAAVARGQRLRLTAPVVRLHLFDAEGRSFLHR